MFEAILFDLDATLLDIDMEFFLKKYFQKMTVMAAEWGISNTEHLVSRVFKSTGVMIDDVNPVTSNEEVFMKDFLADGMFGSEAEVKEFFNYFYEVGFPQLAKYCKPLPGIPEMMERVFAAGMKVVIATNAVFPMKALTDRIAWAGLKGFDYDLVTSYEIMHSCKPHIEYYLEIADKIQVDPRACLMVGNDMGEDLIAGRAGMKTFLVEDMLIYRDVDLKPDWRGKRTDLYRFLDNHIGQG
ncbi:MAG: HAD family hydrolase [Syntrophomonadaceae bacterium]|jgi:FMN phosphatase YigB (HAD superfamily)